jgi:hypothetical protein
MATTDPDVARPAGLLVDRRNPHFRPRLCIYCAHLANPAAVPVARMDPNVIQYNVAFSTKYSNNLGETAKKVPRDGTMFLLSETATEQEFHAALFDHLSRNYNLRINFTSSILEATIKIPRKITAPQRLFGDETGNTYATMVKKAKETRDREVNLSLMQIVSVFYYILAVLTNLQAAGYLKRPAEAEPPGAPAAVRRRVAVEDNGTQAQTGARAPLLPDEDGFARAAAAFGIGDAAIAGIIDGRVGGRGGGGGARGARGVGARARGRGRGGANGAGLGRGAGAGAAHGEANVIDIADEDEEDGELDMLDEDPDVMVRTACPVSCDYSPPLTEETQASHSDERPTKQMEMLRCGLSLGPLLDQPHGEAYPVAQC